MTATTTNETVIALTASAVGEIKAMLAKPENSGKAFRVYVEKGGCSGMQYGMIFDERRDGDFASEQQGVAVAVDPISADYVRGMTVDFSDALTAGGFKISNPNAKQSCGCGKSFTT